MMAVLSILKFYKRTSSVVRPQGALKQFFCVKGLVFLNFIQTVRIPPISPYPFISKAHETN